MQTRIETFSLVVKIVTGYFVYSDILKSEIYLYSLIIYFHFVGVNIPFTFFPSMFHECHVDYSYQIIYFNNAFEKIHD